MKKITIFSEETEPIIFTNTNSTELDLHQYTKEISKYLSSSNVCILTVGDQSLIFKPSKIISILVQDLESPEEVSIIHQDDIIKQENIFSSSNIEDEEMIISED